MLCETINQSGMPSCTIDSTVIDITSREVTLSVYISFSTAIPHYPGDTLRNTSKQSTAYKDVHYIIF